MADGIDGGIAVAAGFGNVFADLGVAEPEEELARRNSRPTSGRRSGAVG